MRFGPLRMKLRIDPYDARYCVLRRGYVEIAIGNVGLARDFNLLLKEKLTDEPI
jgi:hypothetical protein